MNKKCLLLSFMLLISVRLFSQIIVLKSSSHVLNLSPNTSIFEDSLSNLSFPEIQKQKFIPYTKDAYLFPFTDHTFWLKVLIENQSQLQKDWVFSWENAMVENIFFYIPQPNGTFKEIKDGCLVYKPQNRFVENTVNVPFSTFDNKAHTFYVKIQSKRGHKASLVLYPKTDYEVSNFNAQKRSIFVSGLLVLRGVYLLLLAIFVIKDKTFRRYSMLTIFRSLASWAFLGLCLLKILHGQCTSISNFITSCLFGLPLSFLLFSRSIVFLIM